MFLAIVLLVGLAPGYVRAEDSMRELNQASSAALGQYAEQVEASVPSMVDEGLIPAGLSQEIIDRARAAREAAHEIDVRPPTTLEELHAVMAVKGLPEEGADTAVKWVDSATKPDFKPFRDFLGPVLFQYGLMWGFSAATDRTVLPALRWDGIWKNAVPGPNPWDGFTTQYIGHPYKDSISYRLCRDRGLSWKQSSLCSVTGAVIWEYAGEGWYQRVDRVDLLTSATLALLLGETTYRLTRQLEKNGTNAFEKVLIFLMNPWRVGIGPLRERHS